ncbi:MAG: SAM-dependent DNA methyltransferase, partial [Gemmataceae bacterium]
MLMEYAGALQGLATADDARLARQFWEINQPLYPMWLGYQSTPYGDHFSGKEKVVLWEEGKGYLAHSPQARIQGEKAWDRWGIAVKMMGDLRPAFLCQSAFDMNVNCILPKNDKDLAALWSYIVSDEFRNNVRKINQKLNVSNATMVKVSFDLERWQKVAEENYPNGLPKPYSDDPTQWIFHGHPCGSIIWNEATKRTDYGTLRTDENVLQVAMARLLGYRFPAEL